jgi:acylphosphatase
MWSEKDDNQATVPGNSTLTIHAVAYGRVQGVGFRATACRLARRRGLCGYVKNLDDGCVEMEVEGSPSTVREFLDAIEHGNDLIRVQSLDHREIPYQGYQEFSVEGY